MSLIDTNAFLGSWPFSVAPELAPAQFAKRLAEAGVRRALVSHLNAVFCPDPMPANRMLFAAARRQPMFVPVPILNPALATWHEDLEACLNAAPIRAVRILPNYHGYSLHSRRLDPFMDALQAANLRLVLTARMEDERQTYFALKIKGVPVDEIAAFVARFASHRILCTGLYCAEIERLAPASKNLFADLSFAESSATLLALRKSLSLRRILFGSAAPLLSIQAQAAKVRHPAIPAAERGWVAEENARRFFAL